MNGSDRVPVCIKVFGVGGAGGNAVLRMSKEGNKDLEYVAINTDAQALGNFPSLHTIAIGPNLTGGMGSGGNHVVGRKAVRESHEEIARLVEGADIVFLTAGMGGGTGTGATPLIAAQAKRQGALTVAVVTRPFSFEGSRRKDVAERGLDQLRERVDTLIIIDNDKLLPSLGGKLSLESAFCLADQVLLQGVQGISETVTVPGLINVDFADLRALMTNGGLSFMAVGYGKGKSAATDAARSALANPLFQAPIKGASGVLLNVKGGKDLTLGQVHEVAEIIEKASNNKANVIFGVVQDQKWKNRVSLTLVATGIANSVCQSKISALSEIIRVHDESSVGRVGYPNTMNGHLPVQSMNSQKLI